MSSSASRTRGADALPGPRPVRGLGCKFVSRLLVGLEQHFVAVAKGKRRDKRDYSSNRKRDDVEPANHAADRGNGENARGYENRLLQATRRSNGP